MKNSNYAWIITKDLLEPEGSKHSEVGTAGPSTASDELVEQAKTKGKKFRMLDDDKEVYYEGLFIGPSIAEYEPLNDFGDPNAGCTDIQYKKGNKWVTL